MSQQSLQKMEFTLTFVLHCTTESDGQIKQLIFQEPPQTVAQMKERIQGELHIPVCCQDVQLQSDSLVDEEQLQSYRIRNGDTLDLYYKSEADVEKVLDAMDSMRVILDVLTHESDDHLSLLVPVNKLQTLHTVCFHSGVYERNMANKELFVSKGGFHLLNEIHLPLLRQKWKDMYINLQKLEQTVMTIFQCLGSSLHFVSHLFKPSIVEGILLSLLRVKVFLAPAALDSTLKDVMYRAVKILCNLAEFSPCRLQIASNSDVLQQIVASMMRPSFDPMSSVGTLLGLAYSTETHIYLATPFIIDGVYQACGKPPFLASVCGLKLDAKLLNYYSSLFLGLLLTSSGRLISLPYKKKIHTLLKEFLENEDYKVIEKHQWERGYFWTTAEPFLKLVYFAYSNSSFTLTSPSYSSEENEIMTELEMMCIEAGIFGLQELIIRNAATLHKKDYADLVLCLPWNLPHGSKAQARANELAVDFNRQKALNCKPPSLFSIAKAKVAAMHFGLEMVQKENSLYQMLTELYPTCYT